MKTPASTVTRWRENHHRALEALAAPAIAEKGGLAIWRKLRRLDEKITRASTESCNVGGDGYDSDRAIGEVEAILGRKPVGLHINHDPRGYALKIDPSVGGAEIPPGMHKDWGGYGILGAMIEG